MQVIPFTSDPAQKLTVLLGEEKYTFEVRYNDYNGVWTFDLTRASDEVRLLSGVPILLGQDLLAPYALGIGGLVAIDESEEGLDAGPDDFGERVKVVWLTTGELAAFVAGGAVL